MFHGFTKRGLRLGQTPCRQQHVSQVSVNPFKTKSVVSQQQTSAEDLLGFLRVGGGQPPSKIIACVQDGGTIAIHVREFLHEFLGDLDGVPDALHGFLALPQRERATSQTRGGC